MWMVLHVEIQRVLQMQLDTQMHKSRHVRVLNYIINIVKLLAFLEICVQNMSKIAILKFQISST